MLRGPRMRCGASKGRCRDHPKLKIVMIKVTDIKPMATEQLYACPCCKRKGYTEKGLRAHRCDKKTKRRMTPTGPMVRPQLSEAELKKALKNPIP